MGVPLLFEPRGTSSPPPLALSNRMLEVLYFFAVTLQPVIEAAGSADTAATWFLDDGTVAGPIDALGHYLSKFEPLAAAISLSLNPSKCRLWGPSLDVQAASHLPPALQDIPMVKWDDGLRILGTPIGHASFLRTEVTATLEKLSSALDLLGCLACPQSASLILRSCLGVSRIRTFADATLFGRRRHKGLFCVRLDGAGRFGRGSIVLSHTSASPRGFWDSRSG